MILIEIKIVSTFIPVLVDESKSISEQVQKQGFSLWRSCSLEVEKLLKVRETAIKIVDL